MVLWNSSETSHKIDMNQEPERRMRLRQPQSVKTEWF